MSQTQNLATGNDVGTEAYRPLPADRPNEPGPNVGPRKVPVYLLATVRGSQNDVPNQGNER